MRKTVLASAAFAAGLLMTGLLWSSAQATTSIPNPQSALGTAGDLELVGRRGGGGRGGFSRGGRGGHALRGGGGGGRYAHRGGGGGRYAYRGGGGRYASRYHDRNRYDNRYSGYRRYGYRRYGYWPWIGAGAYGSTNCDWLYRHNYRRWLAVCQ
jgi:hypothetical protein